MTRVELQKIKKFRTGLVHYRGPKEDDGYMVIGLCMEVKYGSVKNVKELHDAFRAYLKQHKKDVARDA